MLAREPRDRNAACDRFMDKMSNLNGVFQNETTSFDRETGKPKHFQVNSFYFKGAPSEDTRLTSGSRTTTAQKNTCLPMRPSTR